MDEDVVALLERRHAEIRKHFGIVEGLAGAERWDAFLDLVTLLVMHESAEEAVIHPAVRAIDGCLVVADERVAEELRTRRLLTAVYELGADVEGFSILFAELRANVFAHAAQEEQEEFPLLRAVYDDEGLRALAEAVRAAEAVAPIRPI